MIYLAKMVPHIVCLRTSSQIMPTHAHALIQLVFKLRAINRSDLFLTHLLGSQSCERTFRQLRSMTSTESTVINFTMLDMINRLKKVQLQSDIVSAAHSEIKFPRIQNKKQRLCRVNFHRTKKS